MTFVNTATPDYYDLMRGVLGVLCGSIPITGLVPHSHPWAVSPVPAAWFRIAMPSGLIIYSMSSISPLNSFYIRRHLYNWPRPSLTYFVCLSLLSNLQHCPGSPCHLNFSFLFNVINFSYELLFPFELVKL